MTCNWGTTVMIVIIRDGWMLFLVLHVPCLMVIPFRDKEWTRECVYSVPAISSKALRRDKGGDGISERNDKKCMLRMC